MIKKLAAVLAVVALLLTGVSAPASAAPLTYNDFSRMFDSAGGQHFSGGVVAGQWGWQSVTSTESHIYWGPPWNPCCPPSYHERFIRAGDQVVLDGWWGNGTYYKIATTSEWQADGAACTGTPVVFAPGGPQHYARWLVPSVPYCVFTEGTVTDVQRPDIVIRFRHEQIWSSPAACPANPYIAPGRVCVMQRERWSDDNGHPFRSGLLRDGWLAKGLGFAFKIQNYDPAANPASPGPVTWQSYGRYFWP